MHFLAEPRLAAAVSRFLDNEREQVHRTIGYLQEESELKLNTGEDKGET